MVVEGDEATAIPTASRPKREHTCYVSPVHRPVTPTRRRHRRCSPISRPQISRRPDPKSVFAVCRFSCHGHCQKIRVENRAAPDRKSKTHSSELKPHPECDSLDFFPFDHHNTDSNHGLQTPCPCLQTASRPRPISSSSRRRQHHHNLPNRARSIFIPQLSSNSHRIRVRMLSHQARSRRCSSAIQIQRGWSTMETQMFLSIYLTPR